MTKQRLLKNFASDGVDPEFEIFFENLPLTVPRKKIHAKKTSDFQIHSFDHKTSTKMLNFLDMIFEKNSRICDAYRKLGIPKNIAYGWYKKAINGTFQRDLLMGKRKSYRIPILNTDHKIWIENLIETQQGDIDNNEILSRF